MKVKHIWGGLLLLFKPPLPFRGRGRRLPISLYKLLWGWGSALNSISNFRLREFDIPFGKGSGREGFL